MSRRLSLWSLLLATAASSVGCSAAVKSHTLPPAQQLMEPGPGVGGPGPGVCPPMYPAMPMAMVPSPNSIQILFSRPEGMQVRWDVTGMGQFDSVPLVLPGRHNFPEGGIYQLKITNITGREGTELYPTLEVGGTTPRTAAFLAHNAIPVQFTEDDLDQVAVGNFVTKVIYLPDPEFQELAEANVETLVSTRLEAGMDPIKEADRRGTIMAIVRLGNKDLETPGSMNGSVVPASFAEGGAAAAGGQPVSTGYPQGMMMGAPVGGMGPGMGPVMMAPSGLMPAYVAGVTAPAYGMPISGTPIGLPGPPHIPLGIPAGLQKHSITNHTHMHLPQPTRHLKIDVRQQPGYSYPKPPSHVSIREQNIHPALPYGQPHSNKNQLVP